MNFKRRKSARTSSSSFGLPPNANPSKATRTRVPNTFSLFSPSTDPDIVSCEQMVRRISRYATGVGGSNDAAPLAPSDQTDAQATPSRNTSKVVGSCATRLATSRSSELALPARTIVEAKPLLSPCVGLHSLVGTPLRYEMISRTKPVYERALSDEGARGTSWVMAAVSTATATA